MSPTADTSAVALDSGRDNARGITLNDLLARPDHEYASEDEVQSAGIATVATQRSWASRKKGPARTAVGRTPYYRIGALRAWLLAREIDYDARRRRAVQRGPTKRAA